MARLDRAIQSPKRRCLLPWMAHVKWAMTFQPNKKAAACATAFFNAMCGALFGGHGHLAAVSRGRADHLARQARRARLNRQRHVQHVDLGFARLRQLGVPAIGHIDVAGGAGAGAAAFRGDIQPAITQDFHHAPAVTAFQLVNFALAVGGDDLHQFTPSFFCRLDDEVVYWKRSFSLGRAMWNAACAMRAASWKPDNISFSLPV